MKKLNFLLIFDALKTLIEQMILIRFHFCLD
jgi:hypothetical protein